MSKTLVPGQDYTVRLLDMKTIHVEGIVISDPDGCCTVVINQRLSPEEQRRALQHELDHIRNDDLYDEVNDVAEIERRLR